MKKNKPNMTEIKHLLLEILQFENLNIQDLEFLQMIPQ